jgi:predicted MFS family arabinose efflux permease
VLGAFLAAGLVGSVLGVVLGGVIAEHWGWRAGFGVVGIPGLILALAFRFVVREDRHSAIAGRAHGPGQPVLRVGATLAAVLRPRTLLVTCVGAGLQLIVVSTIWAWMPSYFNRYYGLTPDLAGIKTGVVVLLGGVGAIVWSAVADRLTARHPNARLYVPAAAGVATALLLSTAFGVAGPGVPQFILILAGATAMTGTIGPVAAVVVDVTHPAVRATATAVLSLAQNLIGLAVGPLLTGALSDRFGLPFALTVVPLCGLLSAAMLVLAACTYEADQRKSAHSISGLSHAPKPEVA